MTNAFVRLSQCLDKLRASCPWNASQTFDSLRYLTIEEVYELSEAIAEYQNAPSDPESANDLKKELGDLLMHIFFYAKIADDAHLFSLADVADSATEKMVRRHPYISFADELHGYHDNITPPTHSEQHVRWEEIKMQEGRTSVLQGVPHSLPPLVKAVRMQEKAEGVGYRDPIVDSPQEVAPNIPNNIDSDDFGDTLLRILHWAHRRGINADDALTQANRRYQKRVEAWEKQK